LNLQRTKKLVSKVANRPTLKHNIEWAKAKGVLGWNKSIGDAAGKRFLPAREQREFSAGKKSPDETHPGSKLATLC